MAFANCKIDVAIVFNFKWSTKPDEVSISDDKQVPENVLILISNNQDYYVGGYIIRKKSDKVTCDECWRAVFNHSHTGDHS